ncbi:flavin reductase [Psychrosphaera sp. B3R10]|uniref:flavin reductase family protein n=1 Tax=unclassified Psychrosphaera TaxID=2641570 RepID=UPI001C095C57|nr:MULTISPECIES: flavin reductase [unclassified Psychrosphaera]MBU2881451.1 flavin reductase [Psychrosphaera sp. I2R16]MBU2989537.1 flavin reductase [Psychrosphaera sp. B3R10]
MTHFNENQLSEMPTRQRAQFINSLSGYKSANLVGTIDNAGQTNLAMISSVVHLGASPALMGFIVRPNTVTRHTLENIEQTNQYTINQVNSSIWQQAHQTSARYDKSQSEFSETGLSPFYIAGVSAPFVAESELKYSLELQQIIPIELNGTLFVIGKITNVICNTSVIKQDGYIDIEAIDTVAISGLDSYHQTQRLSRLSYAKPESMTQQIPLDGM